jgi:outer membrane protein TolC
MLRKLVYLTGIITLFLSTGYAQDNNVNGNGEKKAPVEQGITIKGQKLTIAQAVKLVLDRNNDLLSARLDGTMSDSAYQKYQSKYDIYVTADGGIRYQEYPVKQYSKYGQDDKDFDAGVSLKKSFSTGTTVTTSLKEDYLMNTDKAGVSNKSYTPVMYFQLQQELLKNSFGYSERQTVSILDNQTKMLKNGVSSKISSFVASALVDIWDVSLKRVARDNAAIALRETRRVRDVTANNVRLGISETYDLNFYNAMLASYESNNANAEQQYKDSVRKLYRTLNYEINGDVPDIEDFSVLSDTLAAVNIDQALKAAYAKRADYKNAQIALEAAKSQLSVARNDALPSFTVSGAVTSTAIEDSLGTAHGKATTLDSPAYSARFAMSKALGDSTQYANERDARAKLRQSELDLDRIRLIVKDDVLSKAESIKIAYESYQRARTSLQQYERYYSSILANLRMGKTSSAVVKNALDAYNDSRQKEHGALVNYNITLLQFDISTNQLLEKYNIDVDKYISEAK